MIDRIKQWLNNRTITDDIIVRYGISWNGLRLVIPVCDEKGNFLFNKYRRDPDNTLGEKYLYDKGSSATLYGSHFIDKEKSIIICEGELDVLALTSKGFQAVSSTGGSKTFKKEWVDWFGDNEVYICYDTDQPGIEGALKVHSLIENSKIISLPKEFKDVTDFFMAGKSKEDFDVLLKLAFKLPRKKEKHSILEGYSSNSNFTGGDDLQKAKSVPVTNYLQFDYSNKTKCIWHQEKTPSLHYDKKTNRVYCFGCGKGGDVIDVVSQLNNVTIKEAIKLLLNK